MAAAALASTAASTAAHRPTPLSSRRATDFTRARGVPSARSVGGGFRRPASIRAAIFHSVETLRAIDRLEAIFPAEAASSKSGASARTRVPLMAGNWKMNPSTLQEAESLAALVAAAVRADDGAAASSCDVLVCPPAPFLPVVADLLRGTKVQLGAQNIHHAPAGAYTGETSLSMHERVSSSRALRPRRLYPRAASVGCSFVLVGHSERRELFGETDDVVGVKTRAILDAGMSAVLCVGESKAQYEAGMVRVVCATQLEGALAGVSAEEVAAGRVVIAYEPVWAIGTGLTATPAIAQSVHAYIRGWVGERFGGAAAAAVRIQYGGSVKPDSVDELMQCPDVDGCLVGGASLSADHFSRIFGFNPDPPGPRKLWAEEVVRCGNELGESLVWCARTDTLYWVDAPGRALWWWDLQREPVKVDFGETVGMVALGADGTLVVGLSESGMCSYDPRTGATAHLCDFEPGLNTRPNDGRVDRHGNLVIGSYNNNHKVDAQAIGGVYQLSAGSPRLRELLDYKIRVSNATCFTPDGSIMFFCDSPTRRVYAFDYDPDRGLSNRRLVYELSSDVDGVPDGAQCDADGCLWVALSGAGKVVRVNRNGNRVDYEIKLPVKCPTNVTFGGRDLDTLFVTTRGPDGGSLYAVRAPPGVRGVPEVPFGAEGRAPAGRFAATGAAGGGMVTAVGVALRGAGRVDGGGAAEAAGVANGRCITTKYLYDATAAEAAAGGAAAAYQRVGGDVGAPKFCGNCGTAFAGGGGGGRFCTQCGCPR